jgi:integrase
MGLGHRELLFPRKGSGVHETGGTSAAGLNGHACCHTFRATGITAYLENGGTVENAQAIAAHESSRTTKLYDRTDDAITLDEVERIAIQRPAHIAWDSLWFFFPGLVYSRAP